MYTDFSSPRARLLLTAIILVSGIAFFETTAVNVATSAIQQSFSANITLIQWAINSYNLILGVFILIMGSLSDRFGHKRLTLIGLILFTVSTGICGLTSNVWLFIAARVLQGLGGAMMIPQSIAIINASFSSRVRGTAIGIWGGMSGLMTIFGPFISGIIIDIADWHWTFLVIVPFGIAAYFLVDRVVPETKLLTFTPIDWIGIFLLSGGLFSLSWGLIQASSHRWEDLDIVLTVLLGIAMIVLFSWWQKKARYPLIALNVILQRNVFLANLYTLQLYAVISAIAFFAVIFFQQVAGYSATKSGLAIMPVPVLIAAMSVFAGKIADRHGVRLPMITGALLVTIGMLSLLLVGVDAYYWIEIFPGMVLIGLGFGIFIPSLAKTALDVPPEYSGTASGVNNSVSRVAGLLGVAVFGAVLAVTYQRSLQRELTEMNLSESVVRSITIQSSRLMQIDLSSIPGPLADEVRERMRQAFLEAYRLQLGICAALAASGAVSAWYLREDRKQRQS
ncbi:MAG: MFS transporter [Patescibacteria group bacterium]|nr:MFS transporter [Patescibacteria group bacterium]